MINPEQKTESIFNIIDTHKKRCSQLNIEQESANTEVINIEYEIECKERESEKSEKLLNDLLQKIGLVRPIARFCLIIAFSFMPFVVLSYFTTGIAELKLDILFRYKYFFYSLLVVGIVFYVFDHIFTSNMQKIAENCLTLKRQIIFAERNVKDKKNILAEIEEKLELVKNHISALKKADIFFRHYSIYEIDNKINTLILQNQPLFVNGVFQNLLKLESSIYTKEMAYRDSVSGFYEDISKTNSEEEVNSVINSLVQNENELQKLYTVTLKMLTHFSEKNMSEFYKIYYHFEELEMFTISAEKSIVISLNTSDKDIRTAT